ncbi:mesothelin-like protein [Salminus brasiliensis]|uniref:mesothelin-like protein n=1 Tax=Salminus brasiliensis TaxID=930266 RepID=UPI003B835B58
MLFFGTVVGALSDEDSISPQVLQGFTSTRVQLFDTVKVQKLIRGSRRRGNVRVILQESQLTCMYNYIKNDVVTVFTDYPPELLLYYDYTLVNQSLCKDFFSALGYADFSVLSSTLSFRKQILLNSAIQCLKISGSAISRAQLDVLGNMTCMLDSTYIQNSDVHILEKLKQCQDFSEDQISAMENVLLTKNTAYGAPANWTLNTLNTLGILPLYFSSGFWAYFTQKDKAQFMKTFLPWLRARPGLSKQRISSMMNEAQKVSKAKIRLSLRNKRDTACTAGEITQVQASDNSLPFGYDVTQFNVCLSVQALKDNLPAISEKATGSDYQRVILDKLNQAYPTGISDEVLQVLGPASRAATVTDISKWSITMVDTLSALMKSSDGNWTSEQVKAIVGKYLGVSGNSLGSSELNAIGGVNLCALDVSTIRTISSSSLQSASSLSVSTCSLAQKEALFSIAQTAFSDKTLSSSRATSTISSNAYQLIQNYLSGASLAYVQTLAGSSINMDLLTFTSLNPSVVNVSVLLPDLLEVLFSEFCIQMFM